MKLSRSTISTIISTLAVCFMTANQVATAVTAPRLYFETSAVSASKGDTVHLALHVDPGSTPIDTLSVVVGWNNANLKFDGLDTSQSKFSSFIPAVPTSTNGKLAFSTAVLGSTIDSDALVTGLDFTALTSSASIPVSLDGSAAANNGKAVDVITSDAAVYIDGQASSQTGNNVTITGIKVASRSVTGATLEWQTSTATTGSVSYGTDTHYGLIANSAEATTQHSVQLQSVFRGKTTVHYLITARTEDGQSGVSADQQFTTLGYQVQVALVGANHQPIGDTTVSLPGQPSVTTNSQGIATFNDVAPGTQPVHISGHKAQYITVVGLKDAQASKPQSFRLTAQRSESSTPLISIVMVLALALAVFALHLSRKHDNAHVANHK